MRISKRTTFLSLFLIAFFLVGCNSTGTNAQKTVSKPKYQMTTSKPKDFNFVFSYGVGAKNQLDTIKGQYTRDMVIEPSISTALKLSDDEMDVIYSEMKKINILDYPENFKPKSNLMQTPFYTYAITIITDGREKNIRWEDENISETKDAVQLRELFNKIQDIIHNKEEFRKLPEPKSAYQ